MTHMNSIELTHRGRDNMAAISQTTLSNAFSYMKMSYFRLKFHWSLFVRVQLTIIQHCRRPGDKPLFEAMMVRLLTHICVTRPQWVNIVCTYTKFYISYMCNDVVFAVTDIITHYVCWFIGQRELSNSQGSLLPKQICWTSLDEK